MPNESKTVTIQKDESMTLRELAESISVYSLSDVKFSRDKLDTLLKHGDSNKTEIEILNKKQKQLIIND